MKKYSLTLFFFQLLASTIVMMAEANTVNLNFGKTNEDLVEERDIEMETTHEKNAFPDLVTFATFINQ